MSGMSLQKYFTGFLGILFIGLGAYYLVHFGYYPVAVVNKSIITSNKLDTEYIVAYGYYSRALAKNKETDTSALQFKRDLRRAVFADLVEKSLIDQELSQRVGKDIDDIVTSKIENAQGQNNKTLEETAKLVYGLSLADFKELVLIPKAQKEILEGRLFLEKQDFDKWLLGAKKTAKVFIITPEFYWKDGEVVSRD